ncbi:MAG: lipoprotein [Gammaproteobacteria bacterium BRH_c0]|nr:MAG: lipoprotein [Gammaproteobacteria bacterium BRH_c0]
MKIKSPGLQLSTCTLLLTLAALSGCAPEVGSERWCEAMKEKPSGDWTVNEASDFARHCIFPKPE